MSGTGIVESPSVHLEAVAVNHSTSRYMELMLRSMFARHRSGLDLSVTVLDNSSGDDMADLRAYAETVGVQIVQSGFTTQTEWNSHGEALSRFVIEQPDCTHYLFLDPDVCFVQEDTIDVSLAKAPVFDELDEPESTQAKQATKKKRKRKHRRKLSGPPKSVPDTVPEEADPASANPYEGDLDELFDGDDGGGNPNANRLAVKRKSVRKAKPKVRPAPKPVLVSEREKASAPVALARSFPKYPDQARDRRGCKRAPADDGPPPPRRGVAMLLMSFIQTPKHLILLPAPGEIVRARHMVFDAIVAKSRKSQGFDSACLAIRKMPGQALGIHLSESFPFLLHQLQRHDSLTSGVHSCTLS